MKVPFELCASRIRHAPSIFAIRQCERDNAMSARQMSFDVSRPIVTPVSVSGSTSPVSGPETATRRACWEVDVKSDVETPIDRYPETREIPETLT